MPNMRRLETTHGMECSSMHKHSSSSGVQQGLTCRASNTSCANRCAAAASMPPRLVLMRRCSQYASISCTFSVPSSPGAAKQAQQAVAQHSRCWQVPAAHAHTLQHACAATALGQ